MNDIGVPNNDNVLTEDSRQMPKHRKHGFKSANNVTRYSKVAGTISALDQTK